jgi:hypothetical protein
MKRSLVWIILFSAIVAPLNGCSTIAPNGTPGTISPRPATEQEAGGPLGQFMCNQTPSNPFSGGGPQTTMSTAPPEQR